MLILTRRLDEEIMIGDNIKIAVLGVQGGQVRLGIDAPEDVVVHRKEIYDRIKEENFSPLTKEIEGKSLVLCNLQNKTKITYKPKLEKTA